MLVPLEIDDNCWDRVVTQAQAPKSRKRPVGKQLSPIPVAATSFPASQLWKSSYPWVFSSRNSPGDAGNTRYTHWIPSVLRSISEDMRCQIPFASEIKAFARNTPDVVFFVGASVCSRETPSEGLVTSSPWLTPSSMAENGLSQVWNKCERVLHILVLSKLTKCISIKGLNNHFSSSLKHAKSGHLTL